MHNQRCQGSILDFNGGLVAFYSFLDGKGSHASKELLQSFLSGNKVAQGVVDQHVVSGVIGKISVWLKHVRVGADYHIYALLHQEVRPFFFIFGRHWFFCLAPVCRENHAVCRCTGCLDGSCHGCGVKGIYHRTGRSGAGICGCSVGTFCVFFRVLTGIGLTAVGWERVVQESNLDSVYLHNLWRGTGLTVVDSYKGDIRLQGIPVIQGFI